MSAAYTPRVLRLAVEAAIALLLFGCIPVVIKAVDANPFTIGIFRLALTTAALALILASRRELRRIGLADLGRLAVIGALFFGHWITYFLAIKGSTASIGAIGLSTYGVHLLLLSALFRRQRITWADALAVFAAATGAVLVVPSFDLGDSMAVGMLLATISAAMYASLPLLHQRWSHIPTGLRALGQFSFALLFFLLFLPKTNWQLAPRDWLGLLFLAIGPTLVAHTLWVRVTTRFSLPVTSVIYYGNIPFAIALSVLLLDEPLTARAITGAALIILGGVFGLAMRAR